MKKHIEITGNEKLFAMWETIPVTLKQNPEPSNHLIVKIQPTLPKTKLESFIKNQRIKRNLINLKPNKNLCGMHEAGACVNVCFTCGDEFLSVGFGGDGFVDEVIVGSGGVILGGGVLLDLAIVGDVFVGVVFAQNGSAQ